MAKELRHFFSHRMTMRPNRFIQETIALRSPQESVAGRSHR
jgi:hypothetical protein